MTAAKSILVIGLEPTLIDFSDPAFAATGMDAAKIQAGLDASEAALTHLGYDVTMCMVDFGATALDVVRDRLARKRFDCVLIAAGIRTIPSNFLLFEKLVNLAHALAPQARLCFNTKPGDTAEAAQRWL